MAKATETASPRFMVTDPGFKEEYLWTPLSLHPPSDVRTIKLVRALRNLLLKTASVFSK